MAKQPETPKRKRSRAGTAAGDEAGSSGVFGSSGVALATWVGTVGTILSLIVAVVALLWMRPPEMEEQEETRTANHPAVQIMWHWSEEVCRAIASIAIQDVESAEFQKAEKTLKEARLVRKTFLAEHKLSQRFEDFLARVMQRRIMTSREIERLLETEGESLVASIQNAVLLATVSLSRRGKRNADPPPRKEL